MTTQKHLFLSAADPLEALWGKKSPTSLTTQVISRGEQHFKHTLQMSTANSPPTLTHLQQASVGRKPSFTHELKLAGAKKNLILV